MNTYVKKKGYKVTEKIQKNVWSAVDSSGMEVVIKQFETKKRFLNEHTFGAILAEHGVACKVIDTDRRNMIIVTKKMLPIVNKDNEPIVDREKLNDNFLNLMDSKIAVMHSLNIAHGDLSATNIVVDENFEPFIIDFEHSFNIDNHTWDVEEWMRTDYNWQRTYIDFVNHDYENWRSLLDLSNLRTPRDFVSLSEEYYIVRFTASDSNYFVEGQCADFAKLLKEELNDDAAYIVGLSMISEGSVPAHYYVKYKNRYIDGTGIYRNSSGALKVARLLFPEMNEEGIDLRLHRVNAETLDNKDIVCGPPTSELSAHVMKSLPSILDI